MSNELTLFKNGSVPSTQFASANLPAARLDDGLAVPFARVSYKGSKWSIKYQGQIHPVQARMGNSLVQSPFLDVVILKAATHPSKAWYANLYQEGDDQQPDCWSTHGMKPDVGVRTQQSPTCISCPHNVWGSKINRDTGEATRGKACTDSKKLVVVPVGDIENKLYGGPMMLQVPPTGLKRLGPYQNQLEANGFHYAQVYTRITFDPESAYPLFVFDALEALDDARAAQVVKMLQHPLIDRILDTEMRTVEAWDEAGQVMQDAPQQTATVHTLRQPTPATNGAAQPAKPAMTEAQKKIAELEAQLAAAKAPPPPPEPVETPEQKKIRELEEQLAAAKVAPPPPPPPVLTPEQQKIKDLEDQLAAAKGTAAVAAGAAVPTAPARRGAPRGPRGPRTPAVAPTNMTSAQLAGPALPPPVGPTPDDGGGVPGPGNAPDAALDRINATLNKAKDLI